MVSTFVKFRLRFQLFIFQGSSHPAENCLCTVYNSYTLQRSVSSPLPCRMKIKEANAGALTNFEVLDFLRSRGASKDPTRVIVPIAPSEFKVYDYLVESAACNQTKEHINDFLERCKNYKLAKAEVLNIINLRPSALVEIDPIIEQSEKRFGKQLEELVNLVVEVLPEPPTQKNAEQGNSEDKEETIDRKDMDEGERETTNGDEDQAEQTEDGEKMEDS
ncbi:RNA polymerase subunit Rpb4/RPC9 - like 2 [Theobroma cacao]|nr:RNA polymerase subunit Rpb4/RPC9 - like 2 [Theobroma cacao]